MRKTIFLTFIAVLLVGVCEAQVKAADKYFNDNNFETAASLYEKAIKKDSSDVEVIEKAALCFKNINNYEKAEKYYRMAVLSETETAESYLNYGQLLKNNNKIKQAKVQFETYLKMEPGSDFGSNMLASCDLIPKWTSTPTEIQVENFELINSPFHEIGPFPFGDKLMFTSDKNYNYKNGKVNAKLDGYKYGIFIYDPGNKEIPINAISMEINSLDHSEGPGYFWSSGDQIVYTKVYDRASQAVNQIEIHTAKKQGNEWEDVEVLALEDKNFSYTNPVLSPDGKTLYFASDKPGGYGGFDIYKCEIKGSGFGRAVSLRSPVNTEGNEIPNYVDKDGILYFSSTFHPGFGGYDIFKTSPVEGGKWSEPENLKLPYNSTKDDFGFIMVDGNNGYLASNRNGGKGKDDIYIFSKKSFSETDFYTEVNGSYKAGGKARSGFTLYLMDENQQLIQSAVTDANGNFKFAKVPADVKYQILVDELPGDLPADEEMTMSDPATKQANLMERVRKGLFKFQALKAAETASLESVPEIDESAYPTVVILGQLSNSKEGSVAANKRIYVINSDGQTVASTLTDRLGKFKFEKLDMDEQYLFTLEEDDPYMEIQILNEEGEVVGRTIKNKDGAYVYHKFTVNPSVNPDVRGVFKFGNLPADGVTLMLMTEDDEVIQITTTDLNGNFEFTGLVAGEGYQIKLDTNLDLPDNANLFLVDKHTGILMPVSKLNNGTFKFETLSPMPADELELMEEEDYVLKPRRDLNGEVFRTDNKAVKAGMEVKIVDENGKKVAVAKTNDKGKFRFFNLPIQDQYLFSIDEDDPEFAIRVMNKDEKIIAEMQRDENDQFVYHKFSINPSDQPDIRGLFKYGNLPANDVMLNLLDESDEVIQFTTTDAAGEFAFRDLDAGKEYRIEVDKSEKNVPANANMFIMDEYTGLMLPVSKLANGQFKFETLAPIEPEELETVEEEEDVSLVTFSFFGQIFSSLPKDLPSNMEVSIMDKNGKVLATAKADKNGVFNYENLPMSDQYLMQLSEDDLDLNIKIINENGELVKQLSKNSEGKYVFDRTETKDQRQTEQMPSMKYPQLPFEFDNSSLGSSSKKALDEIAHTLRSRLDITLEINSHTDSKGTADYNMRLSARRSNSVKKYLVSKGIDAERIATNNYGETRLLNDCTDDVECPDEKHEENRRVEMKYVRK